MPPKFEIKGIREGLLVTLGSGEWPEIRESLLNHLEEQHDFLQGAQLVLNAGDMALKAADLGSFRDQLSEKGMVLRGVLSKSATTVKASQDLGMATKLSEPKKASETRPLDTSVDGDEALLVRRTLRSGNRVKFPGHVVVIGDVNPGAEIIAGGDVVVWGRLRGTVHAGASGDEEAVVCALELNPTQLRIAEKISITPPQRGTPQPEIARLDDDQVVAEIWSVRKSTLTSEI